MTIQLSTSPKLKGSHKNAYCTNDRFTFGKGTTYGFTSHDVPVGDTLLVTALTQAISPYMYRDGTRSADTVIGVHSDTVLCIDIDSINDIRQEVYDKMATSRVSYCILPTMNHLLGGYFKLRVLIPITGLLTVDDYVQALRYVVHTLKLPDVDNASYSKARFFAPSLPPVGFTYHCVGWAKDKTDCKAYTVVQADVDSFMERLGIYDAEGKYAYPTDFTSPSLAYDEPLMGSFNPADELAKEVSSTISGTEVVTPFEDTENTISTEEEPVTFGSLVGKLVYGGRVMCSCPSNHLHTDPEDKRYAWIRYTHGGQARLYCSSDHCNKLYGEFREIVLPHYTTMVGSTYYEETIQYVESVSSDIKRWFATRFGLMLATANQTGYTEVAEYLTYGRELYEATICENSIKCLILASMRYKDIALTPMVYSTLRDGTITGAVDIKAHSSLNRWREVVFKASYSEISKIDKSVSKASILKEILAIIAEDKLSTLIVKSVVESDPTLLQASKPAWEVTPNGKVMILHTNKYDVVLKQEYERLNAKGVRAYPNYDEVKAMFLRHWSLPLGGVKFHGSMLDDLPSLLMTMSLLNLLSMRQGQQRHTAFVIPAPPSSGKTSLLNNFAKIGLSNDDRYLADIFGYAGLYDQSVDELADKLWVTGDEMSPETVKKSMSMPALLSNLTKSRININVKRQVDKSFSCNLKVLWGARAKMALDNNSNRHELRSRLFVIDYGILPEGEMSDDAFIKACQVDDGKIDLIIQHYLAGRYLALKEWIMEFEVEDRLKLFNQLRESTKVLYEGTKELELSEEDDDGEAVVDLTLHEDPREAIKAMVDTSMVTIATDKQRFAMSDIQLLLEWQVGASMKLHQPNYPTVWGKSCTIYEGDTQYNMLELDDPLLVLEAMAFHSKVFRIPSGNTALTKLLQHLRKKAGNERASFAPVNVQVLKDILRKSGAVIESHGARHGDRKQWLGGDRAILRSNTGWRGAVYELDARVVAGLITVNRSK